MSKKIKPVRVCWRPDNWGNIYDKDEPWVDNRFAREIAVQAFEDGADAMLKALDSISYPCSGGVVTD